LETKYVGDNFLDFGDGLGHNEFLIQKQQPTLIYKTTVTFLLGKIIAHLETKLDVGTLLSRVSNFKVGHVSKLCFQRYFYENRR